MLQLSGELLPGPNKTMHFLVLAHHCEYLLWLIQTERLLSDLPALCTSCLLLSSPIFIHSSIQCTVLLSSSVEAPYNVSHQAFW